MNNKNYSSVTVSPNPAKDNFKIRLKGFEKGQYRIEFFNSLGQKQFLRTITVSQTVQDESFVLPNIRVGVYLINIINENTGDTRSVKLVIE